MNSPRIARAIDVGYGNTKFTVGDFANGSEIECRMFPSVAPVSKKQALDSHMGKKDVVAVEIDRAMYEVGPDAMLSMTANSGRTLDLSFAKRPTYMALVRGALFYMNVPHVDHLVLGLPVSSVEVLGPDLEDRVVGRHEVAGRTIEVRECKVVPQPVGGMWDYAVRNRLLRELQNANNLLIDPGYFTLDWVLTKGFKMIGVRSGAANNAGMAAILRAVGESMANTIKEREGRPADLSEGSLDRMDEAIRLETPFRFNGKVEDLAPHMNAGMKVVSDALDKLVHTIGTKSDIDNVIIVGGAAHLYKDAVSRLFAGHDVRVAQHAVFANVRGFQMIADRRAQAVATAPEADKVVQ